jgi:uncharacterized OsmC-like protein
MAAKISGKYKGHLRVSLIHGPSGTEIETDAPLDNHGKGEKFSPTDLVAASLSACLLTIMGIVAERDNIDLSGMSFNTEKHMSTEAPRRISKIIIEVTMPKALTADQRKKLENAARTCPVQYSLSPELEKIITFNYDA